MLNSGLAVRPAAATARGRLESHWEEGHGLISIVTREPGLYPAALNLADLIILDAEEDGRVLEIGIGMPAERWQVAEFPELPKLRVEADLILDSDEKDAYEDVPLAFLTNARRNQLLVVIGDWTGTPDLRIDMSSTASVLSFEGKLAGILAARDKGDVDP